MVVGMTVDDLIHHLQTNFDGDEKVWFRVSDDPDSCYSELGSNNVTSGSVVVDDEDTGPCCIIGEVW